MIKSAMRKTASAETSATEAVLRNCTIPLVQRTPSLNTNPAFIGLNHFF